MMKRELKNTIYYVSTLNKLTRQGQEKGRKREREKKDQETKIQITKWKQNKKRTGKGNNRKEKKGNVFKKISFRESIIMRSFDFFDKLFG